MLISWLKKTEKQMEKKKAEIIEKALNDIWHPDMKDHNSISKYLKTSAAKRVKKADKLHKQLDDINMDLARLKIYISHEEGEGE